MLFGFSCSAFGKWSDSCVSHDERRWRRSYERCYGFRWKHPPKKRTMRDEEVSASCRNLDLAAAWINFSRCEQPRVNWPCNSQCGHAVRECVFAANRINTCGKPRIMMITLTCSMWFLATDRQCPRRFASVPSSIFCRLEAMAKRKMEKSQNTQSLHKNDFFPRNTND